jgi:hypothetical protein
VTSPAAIAARTAGRDPLVLAGQRRAGELFGEEAQDPGLGQQARAQLRAVLGGGVVGAGRVRERLQAVPGRLGRAEDACDDAEGHRPGERGDGVDRGPGQERRQRAGDLAATTGSRRRTTAGANARRRTARRRGWSGGSTR